MPPSRESMILASGLPENHAEYRRRMVDDIRSAAMERWAAYHDHPARKELETVWKLIDQMIRCDLDETEKQEIGRANISPPVVHDAWLTKTAKASEILFASSDNYVDVQPIGSTSKELAELAGQAVQADF